MVNNNENEGAFSYHTSCDSCGSTDARAVYTNGTAYCFSCSSWSKEDTATDHYRTKERDTSNMELVSVEYSNLKKRHIPEAITRKYNYGIGHDKNGNLVQVANYYNKDKQVVAQKLRTADKNFKFIGNPKESLMFGQQLWANKGKKLVITEGELDCLSVATAFDGKYPVVSIKNGIQAAKKEISHHLDWITGYDEVYLWFDNDEHGRKGLEECLPLLPIEKVKIIRHADYKDANEVLIYTGKSGVVNTFYNAEKFKPDDIVSPEDLLDTVAEPITVGFPYYYDQLTKLLYGRRFGEVVTVGAGVSVNN